MQHVRSIPFTQARWKGLLTLKYNSILTGKSNVKFEYWGEEEFLGANRTVQ